MCFFYIYNWLKSWTESFKYDITIKKLDADSFCCICQEERLPTQEERLPTQEEGLPTQGGDASHLGSTDPGRPTSDHTLNQRKEEFAVTKCNHIYHKICLYKWLDRHNSCPLCRKSLRIELDTTTLIDLETFILITNGQSLQVEGLPT